MTALSICIPTFNRASYLARLLDRLADELGDAGDAIEVLVSDNASTDDTAAVCAASRLGTRLRYVRQETNIGAEANMLSALCQARGKYAVYLADDDILIWPGVTAALDRLEAEPEAVALYAPWYLVDLVADSVDGTFYSHPETEVIDCNDHLGLARHVLEHEIFSEILICRTDAYRRVMPAKNDLAYWAFTVPAELLRIGKVIYATEPFYGSVTRHPGEDGRSQLGSEEVQVAWDRYRGGVEHIIGLARAQATPSEIAALVARGARLVQERMLVALRLRLAARSDPLESYYLASRLRGLGLEARLPAPLDKIRSLAAIHALDANLARPCAAKRIVLAGEFSPDKIAMFTDRATLPVEVYVPGTLTAHDVVLVAGDGSAAPATLAEEPHGVAITETDLLAKFP